MTNRMPVRHEISIVPGKLKLTAMVINQNLRHKLSKVFV